MTDFGSANAELIRSELPPWPRRVSGYALDWLVSDGGSDLPKALVGTEGTCVVVARAVVRLVRPLPTRSLVVLGFADDIAGAGRVPDLLKAGPYTLESLSAELLALAHAKAEDVGLPAGGAWLMVEARGEDAAAARAHAERLADAVGRTLAAPEVRFIEDAGVQAALWKDP